MAAVKEVVNALVEGGADFSIACVSVLSRKVLEGSGHYLPQRSVSLLGWHAWLMLFQPQGRTPLHSASLGGHDDVVAALLVHHPAAINKADVGVDSAAGFPLLFGRRRLFVSL
jgi:hypothetical protein